MVDCARGYALGDLCFHNEHLLGERLLSDVVITRGVFRLP